MAKLKCPHCGQYIEITARQQRQRYQPVRSGNYSMMQSSFKNAVAGAIEPTPIKQPDYSETPAHLPTFESHVKVPAAQALITAVFVAPAIGAACSVIGYNFGDLTTLGVFVVFGGVTIAAFFAVAGYNWLSRVAAYNQLLWKIEEFLNTDIDGDGQTGKPEPRKIEVTVTEGNKIRKFTPPGDEVSAWNFASDVINGVVNFSESGAQQSGYGVTNFRELRDDHFIPNGWAVWIGGKRSTAGVQLTVQGRGVLRRIAQEKPQWSDNDDIWMDDSIQK